MKMKQQHIVKSNKIQRNIRRNKVIKWRIRLRERGDNKNISERECGIWDVKVTFKKIVIQIQMM